MYSVPIWYNKAADYTRSAFGKRLALLCMWVVTPRQKVPLYLSAWGAFCARLSVPPCAEASARTCRAIRTVHPIKMASGIKQVAAKESKKVSKVIGLVVVADHIPDSCTRSTWRRHNGLCASITGYFVGLPNYGLDRTREGGKFSS